MKKFFTSNFGTTRWLLPLLIGVFLVLGIGTAYLAYQIFWSEPDAGQVFPKYSQPKDMATAQLEQALQVAMQRHPDVLSYLLYRVSITNVTYSEDKKTALLWLSLYDKDTDTLVPSEPGLAIAQRGADGSWTVKVQTDGEYNALLKQIPASMVDDETRAQYLSEPQPLSKGVNPLRGYRLPWKKGVTKFLTGSIGHVLTYKSCPSSCLYAFDFADGGNFPIMAAKGGVVKYAVWKYPDENHTNANYIILEDPTTNPVTYQVYFHLSQNTIPEALRTPGTWVNQGQFIGNVDNTGYSSGPHLHFHVHANATSFWGNSVDIVFDDVTVNGGRPRTCTEAQAFPSYGTECMPGNKYTSNNGDSKPPTGVLSAPAANTVVKTAAVSISGYGSDESGVAKIQPVVNYDGVWRSAGPAITTEAFVSDLDLCAAGVPDGPLSLGLDLWDNGGNKTTTPIGAVAIRKQFTCPVVPPACSPSEEQIALYNNAQYQGHCELLGVGEVADMASLTDFGDNNLESIQVGSAVSAMLFDGSQFTGRNQAINTSIPDLSAVLIGSNLVSSLKVVNLLPVPSVPVLNAVTGPNGAALTADDSVILSWQPAVGALEYQAEVKSAEGFSAAQDWQAGNSFSVGTLKAGTYQWKVIARNSAGEKSATANFTVQAGSSNAATPIATPYEAAFTSTVTGWTATGSWQRIGFKLNSESQQGWVFGSGSAYAKNDSAVSGDLTSPPIFIGYAGQQFTFRHASGVEGNGPVWDQRRVQISVDGATFQEWTQVTANTSDGKLTESQPVDLSAYAGKTIRIRFHFDSIDGAYNEGLGWAITAMRVSDDPAQVCAENADDGSADKAQLLKLGSTQNGQVCPSGDVDFYSLSGTEKQPFTATLNISSSEKGWSPVLVLFDADAKTVLAEGKISDTSAQINTILPKTGVYYLKVSAQSPSKAAVPGVDYRLSLIQDTTPPTVKLTKPTDGSIPLTLPITLAADAADAGNPVSRVEFYIQPASVAVDKADRVAVDDNGQDGWNGSIPEGFAGTLQGGAIFARAYDLAGNHTDSAAVVLAGDGSTPVTRLEPLPSENGSTMIRLKWSVSSKQKVDHFELQYQQNGGDWQAWAEPLAANLRETSFFAKSGTEYGFRIRAITESSAEEFAAEAQAKTKVEEQCTPDKFEPADNAPAAASDLQTGGGQLHNLCGVKDVDWSSMLLQGGKAYTFTAKPQDLPAGVTLQIFDMTGTALSDEISPDDLGAETALDYQPETTGTYLLRARAADDHLAGTDVIYNLSYDQASPFSPIPVVCGALLIPLVTALFKLWGNLKAGLNL